MDPQERSYLGVPFITQQVERNSELLSQTSGSEVIASFLSLSDRLSDSFEKEFEKKMSGTNIPVILKARSLDSLLQQLTMSLKNDDRLHRSWYDSKLLTGLICSTIEKAPEIQQWFQHILSLQPMVGIYEIYFG